MAEGGQMLPPPQRNPDACSKSICIMLKIMINSTTKTCSGSSDPSCMSVINKLPGSHVD